MSDSDIRAVLFDVDGTLYVQKPLRALMAAELAVATVRSGSISKARHLARVLGTFRHVREEMRALGEVTEGTLDDLQFRMTGDRCGVEAATVRALVTNWMYERPLKHMRLVQRAGVQPMLDALQARRIQVGALSDYPVDAKLRALGIADRFSVKLCTADGAINAFKPHPKGFLRACEAWGLAPREVVYVGDRPEIDGVGAAAAGMGCVIVGRRTRRRDADGDGPRSVRAFGELARALALG